MPSFPVKDLTDYQLDFVTNMKQLDELKYLDQKKTRSYFNSFQTKGYELKRMVFINADRDFLIPTVYDIGRGNASPEFWLYQIILYEVPRSREDPYLVTAELMLAGLPYITEVTPETDLDKALRRADFIIYHPLIEYPLTEIDKIVTTEYLFTRKLAYTTERLARETTKIIVVSPLIGVFEYILNQFTTLPGTQISGVSRFCKTRAEYYLAKRLDMKRKAIKHVQVLGDIIIDCCGAKINSECVVDTGKTSLWQILQLPEPTKTLMGYDFSQECKRLIPADIRPIDRVLKSDEYAYVRVKLSRGVPFVPPEDYDVGDIEEMEDPKIEGYRIGIDEQEDYPDDYMMNEDYSQPLEREIAQENLLEEEVGGEFNEEYYGEMDMDHREYIDVGEGGEYGREVLYDEIGRIEEEMIEEEAVQEEEPEKLKEKVIPKKRFDIESHFSYLELEGTKDIDYIEDSVHLPLPHIRLQQEEGFEGITFKPLTVTKPDLRFHLREDEDKHETREFIRKKCIMNDAPLKNTLESASSESDYQEYLEEAVDHETWLKRDLWQQVKNDFPPSNYGWASAFLGHFRRFVQGTEKMTSIVTRSDGSYEIPEGMYASLPVEICTFTKRITIVKDLQLFTVTYHRIREFVDRQMKLYSYIDFLGEMRPPTIPTRLPESSDEEKFVNSWMDYDHLDLLRE